MYWSSVFRTCLWWLFTSLSFPQHLCWWLQLLTDDGCNRLMSSKKETMFCGHWPQNVISCLWEVWALLIKQLGWAAQIDCQDAVRLTIVKREVESCYGTFFSRRHLKLMKLDLSNSKHKRASVSPNPDREWLSEWFFFRHAYFQDILDNWKSGLSHTDCHPDSEVDRCQTVKKSSKLTLWAFLCAYTPVYTHTHTHEGYGYMRTCLGTAWASISEKATGPARNCKGVSTLPSSKSVCSFLRLKTVCSEAWERPLHTRLPRSRWWRDLGTHTPMKTASGWDAAFPACGPQSSLASLCWYNVHMVETTPRQPCVTLKC